MSRRKKFLTATATFLAAAGLALAYLVGVINFEGIVGGEQPEVTKSAGELTVPGTLTATFGGGIGVLEPGGTGDKIKISKINNTLGHTVTVTGIKGVVEPVAAGCEGKFFTVTAVPGVTRGEELIANTASIPIEAGEHTGLPLGEYELKMVETTTENENACLGSVVHVKMLLHDPKGA
jgi:hypothetical protein